MPERKTLNEDLFYKGSSANLPRLHTCENIKSRFGILKNLPSQYYTQELNIDFLSSYVYHHIQDSMIKCKLYDLN